MTKPRARTATITRPTTSRPAKPATPHTTTFRPAAFAPNVFAPIVFASSPFAARPFAGPAINDEARFSFRAPTAPVIGPGLFRPRHPAQRSTRRRIVLLPSVDSGARSQEWWLPAEEIDYILETCTGEYRWGVGDECDFTYLAHEASYVYGCEWGSCGATATEPHLHPLTAAALPAGVPPVCWADVEQYLDDIDTARHLWVDQIAPLIAQARRSVLADPERLFADQASGPRRAREILSVAGHPSIGQERSPISVVLEEQDRDPSVQSATADLGAIMSSGSKHGQELDRLLDRAQDAGYRLWHPDDLQYLGFDRNETAANVFEVLGNWRVMGARYRSAFDQSEVQGTLPWCLGWRELSMCTRD